MLHCAGVIGVNPTDDSIAESVEDQVHQAMKNLGVLLTSQGTSYSNIVRA